METSNELLKDTLNCVSLGLGYLKQNVHDASKYPNSEDEYDRKVKEMDLRLSQILEYFEMALEQNAVTYEKSDSCCCWSFSSETEAFILYRLMEDDSTIEQNSEDCFDFTMSDNEENHGILVRVCRWYIGNFFVRRDKSARKGLYAYDLNVNLHSKDASFLLYNGDKALSFDSTPDWDSETWYMSSMSVCGVEGESLDDLVNNFMSSTSE